MGWGDADVEVSQRKHDANRLELHECKREGSEEEQRR